MKADFSRLRLDETPGDEWLQQQGRLWLDSDWNEAALARLRRLELHLGDLVGRRGRPEPGTAFRIADAGGGELSIGGGPGAAGHLYVDGVLATNPAATTYSTQPDYPGAPPLPLPSATSAGWQVVGDLALARAGHGAALVRRAVSSSDALVLVCGGSAGGTVTAQAELFDPAGAQWAATGPMTTARTAHSVTVLPDGRVLVAGGVGPAGAPVASAELYDPGTGTWAATGSLTTARSGHTATLLVDGRVLVAGGFATTAGSLGGVGDALASAELYSPASRTWAATSPMTRPRARHVAARLDRPAFSGAVLVAGGHADGTALASCDVYEPATSSWRARPDLTAAREGHTVTVLADGRALVVGGSGAAGPLDSCETLDPGGTGWSTAASLATARTGHAAVRVVAGQVLVAGGHRGDRPLASTELYDPGADRWTSGRALAEARAWHRSTVLTDGSVLVSGGTSAAAPLPGAGGETPGTELLDPVETTVGVAYLEVWRRLVTFLQDDRREVALGGPDTTVQLRTVAQVKVVAVPAAHRPAALDRLHAAAYLPDGGAGRLSTVETATVPAPADPCDVPADGTYSGRENRLYRVEIHDDGEMLGALSPAPLPLTANALGGTTELEVAALTPPQRTSLLSGRWDLVAGPGANSLRETVSIADAAADGTVRLDLPVRHAGYLAAAGAALVPRRDVASVAQPAATGDRALQLVPGEGPNPAEAASGPLARRGWYVRSGQSTEAVTVVSYDPSTGVATLTAPLRSAVPAGAQLVQRARYTWSSENAGFATAVTAVLRSDVTAASTTLQVGSLGRDRASWLRVGDLVEICGDADDLGRGRGLLCRVVAEPDPDRLSVTVDAAHPLLTPARTAQLRADHVVLRRWDGVGFVGPDDVDLGDGVRIRFSGYDFRASAYWWFTTRAREASVERLDAVAPHGILRHRTPLAVLHWQGDADSGVTLERVVDCVPVFDPLTDLQARHVRYDDTRTNLGASTVQAAIEALAPTRVLPRVDRNGISWRNDRPLSVTAFNEGLTVRFTEPMAAASLTDRTVEVWLHVPDDELTLLHPVRVPGVVTPGRDGAPATGPAATAVTFRPRAPLDPVRLGQWITRAGAVDGGAGLRAVVVLHGDKILDDSGTRPLDGTVFGRITREGYDLVTELVLPSGDGTVGGDFESWLFVTGPPAPARVTSTDPPPGLAPTLPPAAIHVVFSKDVRRATVTPQGRVVVQGPGGAPVPGRVEPFPFNPAAEAWSGITFTPRDPAWLGQGAYTLVLSSDITDVDGLGLDGDGDGRPSDFTAQFAFDQPPAPRPARVSRVSPADRASLNGFPRSIRVEFDKLVRIDTLTAETVEVGMAPLADPVAFGPVEGTIAPIDPAAGLARGFTFTPRDRRSLVLPGLFVLDLHGDGPHPVVDSDGLPLDGQGIGQGSRFGSSFEVGGRQ